MDSRLRRRALIGTTAALTLALATPGIASASSTSPRATLDGAPTWTAHAKREGKTAAGQQHSLKAVLAMRNASQAIDLANAVSDPKSAQYGKFVSAATWRSRFAPTDAQLAKVTSWLKSNGFSVGEVPANHRYVSFTGTTAAIDKAFGASLENYSKSGRSVSAPSASVTVPADIATVVSGIAGLDGSLTKSPNTAGGPEGTTARAAAAASQKAVAAKSPKDVLPPPSGVFKNARPCSAYYGEKPALQYPQILADPLSYAPCGYKPAQLRGAYGIDSALSQGYDGRGATVAVVDAYASPYIFGDAQTYAARNDASHPLRGYQFSQSLPATFTNTDLCGAAGWYGEETLDVEAVHAMAPAANILYVGGTSCLDNDLDAAVNSVVDNSLAQVVTNSYGDTGEPSSKADVAFEHQTAIQAAAQGISLLFSSGDNGDEITHTGTRQVDYEASDPFVTAVGGTALAVGATNNYEFEQGWGTGKSILTNGQWSPNPPAYVYGGGGGTSRLFTEPKYQVPVVPTAIANHFGNGPHRTVPDVAMDADPSTGFLVGQSQSFPDGSIKYSEYRIGGTSLASPLFAGVTAVADQNAGRSLGFLNPLVYSLAGSTAFRDVNHGRAVTDGVVRVDFANGIDASNGKIVSLRTLNQTGTIFTRKGYDDVTGVGSPNGVDFLNATAGASSK